MGKNINTLIGNSVVLKHVNRVRLLQHLRIKGDASRADLARITGLDAKTITNIMNDLLADKLVCCEKMVVSKNKRGRRPEKVSINPEAAFGLGVDVGASQVTAVLVDFQGNIKDKYHKEFGESKSSKVLLAHVDEGIVKLTKGLSKADLKKIDGIGICVPGFINRDTGTIIKSVNIPGSENVPIVPLLEKRFGMEVILEKSSRAMAITEIWYEHQDNNSNFLCIDLGFGIGLGIVCNGLIYRGAAEISGEIGHVTVCDNGIKCHCGKTGCLETVAGGEALIDEAKKLDLSKYGIKSRGGKAIHEAAIAGDARAKEMLKEIGEYIGIAIANAINLLDPEFVVLSGGLTRAGKFIMKPLRDKVEKNCIDRPDHNPEIQITKFGYLAGALGAAMLPLRKYFEFENIRF